MKQSIYSRQLFPILALFTVMVFSGAHCIRVPQLSRKPDVRGADKPSTRVPQLSRKPDVRGADKPSTRVPQLSCEPDVRGADKPKEPIPYLVQLLDALYDSANFTEQRKQDIANVILDDSPRVAAFENEGCLPEQVFSIIDAEITKRPRRDQEGMNQEKLSKDSKPWVNDDCSLCLEKLEGDVSALPGCLAHYFHDACIRELLDRFRSECPLCRAPFNQYDLKLKDKS